MANASRTAEIVAAIDARLAELSAAPELAKLDTTPWTELGLTPSIVHNEIQALQCQRTVWDILERICSEVIETDLDDTIVLDEGSSVPESHRTFLQKIRASCPVLTRAQSVVDWCEQCHRSDDIAIASDWGVPLKQTLLHGGTGATSFDPDAVIRGELRLHHDDVNAESLFWRSVWSLLIAGRLHQGDQLSGIPSVFQLCQSFGHDYLAISLSGGLPYHATRTSQEGNPHRWLWAHSCLTLCEQESISSQERAAYAVLAGGNAKHVFPVCHSWIDYIWATCICFSGVTLNQRLYDKLQHPLDPPDVVNRSSSFQINVESLMDQAERAFFESHPTASKSSYDRLIKYLIVNDRAAVLDELLQSVESIQTSLRRVHHKGSYLEFAFRLYMILVNEPTVDGSRYAQIVVVYVRYLAEQPDMIRSIPEASQYLPNDLLIEEYARIVRQCKDPKTREWLLNQAHERFNEDIVEQIQSRLLSLMVVPMSASRDVINSTIADLASCRELSPATALQQANRLYREFMSNRDLVSALQLCQAFPTPISLHEDIAEESREFHCWASLLKAHSKIADLERHSKKRQVSGVTSVGNDDIFPMPTTSTPWLETQTSFLDVARRTMFDVIDYPGGWNCFPNEPERDRELASLRSICVPDIVLKFITIISPSISVNVGAQPNDYSASIMIDLTNSITRSGSGQLFHPNQIRQVLTATRNAFLIHLSATQQSVIAGTN